jgi:PleD family two-component response regulator
VESHGGTVRAERGGVGKGATFIVDLPHRLHSNGSAHQRSAVDTQPPLTTSNVLRGIRVLVVDDSADTCELLTVILRQYGMEPSSTTSAREALSLVESVQPDAIVCDIAMPGIDGFQLHGTS